MNRDNSGRISGIGRNGATVRGGRLKTAKGNKRATQIASMRPAGFRSGTIAKGGRGVRGSVARSLAAVRKERMAKGKANQPVLVRKGAPGKKYKIPPKPVAAKQQPQKPSKKPVNKAQRAYLDARSNARDRNRDLRGADAGSRRMANSAAAVLRNMERRRSAAVPKAPADSPRAKQQQRQLARSQRAGRNERAAWAREADGPNSKASRSATVARRAQQIYAGKVDPKAKTKSRLTKTRDPEVLRKRIAKIKDNTARAAAKAAKAAAKKAAKATAASPTKKAARGPKANLPRMATPTGVIRGSDRAKVKADARKGIGTPYSRASQRAFDRSAREAPLQRKQAIAAAKRKGRTGFGKGPQMNTASIGNRDFNWNRNEQPATAQERLAMWRKGERRMRGFWSGGRGVAGAYAGDLRASRRGAALVDSGNRLGNLPTTRKMAEQPRQRRNDRISRNETQGRIASSEASRRLLPQIQKVRDAAQKRITEGKKPTAAQKEKERKLVGEYNKAARKLQVAQAAKEYTSNPYGFKPQRMSGAVKAKPKLTAPKRTRSARPAGTVAKPRGMKTGVLARRAAKAGKLTGKGKAPVSRLVKPVKQADGSFDVNGRPAKTMQDAMRVLRQQRAQEKERALSAKRIDANKRVERADLRAVEKGTGKRAANAYARENAIYRFSQKQDQASKRADQVATKGKALEAEYTRLTRKPASEANDKRIQEVKSQITRLRRSFDTLLKASKSYKQRGLDVRRPFPRIYK